MGPTLLVVVVLLISCYTPNCSTTSLQANSNSNHDWGSSSRTLETYFSRLGTRLDQLVLRMDHLDSRINRFTSLLQGRLDGVENSLATSKLKMDLWSEDLSRIEEQLSRKWKNVESKFDLLVPTIDSKLENKLTLIQRDNRRHNEHLSNLLVGLGARVDVANEKVVASVASYINSTTRVPSPTALPCPLGPNPALLPNRTSSWSTDYENKLMGLLEDFGNRSTEILKSGSAVSLIGTKVTNMFEDLISRADNIETGLKDSINLANLTRREVAESLRTASQSRLRSTVSSMGVGSSMSSSETMSAVIVEALASVESMSTALGRRMAELSRSIEERFEMVSMTLNGFLESCIRIQDGAPLIEEHIAAVLERIIDGFENNTRSTHVELYGISGKLDLLLNGSTCTGQSLDELLSHYIEETSGHPMSVPVPVTPVPPPTGPSLETLSTAELVKNSQDLTEEEKKLLWDSLFPNHNVPD